ncbi:MAG TPA: TIR domain-containing protein [Ktedonosporobacter sp.]|jgi:nucleoside phosphorylase|nr:TIR domain-containing protein [Ktedonosporobacter sp.]
MEKQPRLFDVCIVCALYEEASALIDEFQLHYAVSFTQAFSRLDQYEYRWSTIQNNCGEPLTVLVSWLPESGPVRTGLDLRPFLEEFRPRFAAMTGFCAGYQEKVHLGDLVIAEYAYHYEEGKIVSGSDGQQHQPELKTAHPTARVLQYVKGFDGWRKPVDALKCRLLNDFAQSERHIAPMASGMAVRADNLFPWLTEYRNRKTLGLDMEAATFYLALRSLPQSHALVVKGVCDYADGQKNDNYHDYAARASAVYMLHFIQEYVTQQTMPRRDDSDRVAISGDADVPLRIKTSPTLKESNNDMLSSNKIKEFDVFLCHNSLDKEEVREIGRQLQKEQIRPWLDEWELLPGCPWQRALEDQIAHIKSAAIFFGAHGIRNWHWLEAEAFLREFVSRGCPVIPVIMSSAPSEPEIPLFLKGMMWVDFRQERPDPLHQLIRGIRGAHGPDPGVVHPPIKPTKIRATYQPSREGNKGMILFLLNGTEHALEYMRRDNLSHQIFFLKRKEQELVRLLMPFATLKSLEKCAEFQIDGVDCRFTIKMSAVTSIMSVKLEIGGVEVFRT